MEFFKPFRIEPNSVLKLNPQTSSNRGRLELSVVAGDGAVYLWRGEKTVAECANALATFTDPGFDLAAKAGGKHEIAIEDALGLVSLYNAGTAAIGYLQFRPL